MKPGGCRVAVVLRTPGLCDKGGGSSGHWLGNQDAGEEPPSPTSCVDRDKRVACSTVFRARQLLLERFQVLAVLLIVKRVRPFALRAATATTATAALAGPAIPGGFQVLLVTLHDFQDGVESFLGVFLGQVLLLVETAQLFAELRTLLVVQVHGERLGGELIELGDERGELALGAG